MYVLFRIANSEYISTYFADQGFLPDNTADACVINKINLTSGSIFLCAFYCGRNFLCNAFDICNVDGQHVCHLRYGKMTNFSNASSSCRHYEIESDLDCPDGFFLRSAGICKNNNLALHSSVTMSSVYNNPAYAFQGHGDGSLVVDGKVKSNDTECSLTNADLQPWFIIDLLDHFYVRRVIFVNRKTSEWRLHDLNVTVGTNNVTFPCFCGFFSGPGTSHQKVDMVCAETCRGRYVRLQITSPAAEHLQLCEVDVYSDCNI
ncbi:uncharacterized protein LOC133175911 [Saccostrea echinata]|uniref:uncharacterized protein LOC133175911 n=1 Tax=Saccostrea echinata TaxID=191078 RepID=UPI002A81942C|nr:uncharacterized protein LOC133175911 [Saccostrea echinata]